MRYEGHMGVYNIDVSILEGTTLKTQKIADGVIDLYTDTFSRPSRLIKILMRYTTKFGK